MRRKRNTPPGIARKGALAIATTGMVHIPVPGLRMPIAIVSLANSFAMAADILHPLSGQTGEIMCLGRSLVDHAIACIDGGGGIPYRPDFEARCTAKTTRKLTLTVDLTALFRALRALPRAFAVGGIEDDLSPSGLYLL